MIYLKREETEECLKREETDEYLKREYFYIFDIRNLFICAVFSDLFHTLLIIAKIMFSKAISIAYRSGTF